MTDRRVTTTSAGMLKQHQEHMNSKGSQDVLQMLLGGAIDPRRFTMTALMCVSKNKALLRCDPKSLFLALALAAELGLECSGITGHAYLVPYGGEVQLQPGFKGLIELAVRAKVAKKIESEVIYSGEDFNYDRGTGVITHPYDLTIPKNDEDIVGAYAKAVLYNGETVIEVMDRAQLEKRKSAAKTKDVWNSWFPEMCRKTAIKNLFARGKIRIPPGGLLAKGLDADTSVDMGTKQDHLKPTLVVTDMTDEAQETAPQPTVKGDATIGKKPDWDAQEPNTAAETAPGDEMTLDSDVEGNAAPDRPKPAKKAAKPKPKPKPKPAEKATASPSNKMATPARKKDALDQIQTEQGWTEEELVEVATNFGFGDKVIDAGGMGALAVIDRLSLAKELQDHLST